MSRQLIDRAVLDKDLPPLPMVSSLTIGSDSSVSVASLVSPSSQSPALSDLSLNSDRSSVTMSSPILEDRMFMSHDENQGPRSAKPVAKAPIAVSRSPSHMHPGPRLSRKPSGSNTVKNMNRFSRSLHDIVGSLGPSKSEYDLSKRPTSRQHYHKAIPGHSLSKPASTPALVRPVVANGSSVQAATTPSPSSSSSSLSKLSNLQHVVNEIVDTERTYSRDLGVIVDVFYKALHSDPAYMGFVSAQDVETLFSNVREIHDLARQFSTEIEDHMEAIFDHHVPPESGALERAARKAAESIGGLFIKHMPHFEEPYNQYCSRFLDQQAVCNQIRLLASPAVDSWFRNCYLQSSQSTTAGTLDSLLIKPVQRLTKYPLLLRTLVSCYDAENDDSDSGRAVLSQALHVVSDIANRINTRSPKVSMVGRSDSGSALRNDANASAVLNRMVDAFHKRHGRVKALVKELRQGLVLAQRHFSYNCQLATAWFDCMSLDGFEQSDRSVYRQYSEALPSEANKKLAAAIERDVVRVLESVESVYKSTARIIALRMQCHGDFVAYVSTKGPFSYAEVSCPQPMSEDKSISDATTIARADQFLKYHVALIDGLPDLFSLTDDVVGMCVARFLAIQQSWFQVTATSLSEIAVAGSGQTSNSPEAIVTDFRSNTSNRSDFRLSATTSTLVEDHASPETTEKVEKSGIVSALLRKNSRLNLRNWQKSRPSTSAIAE